MKNLKNLIYQQVVRKGRLTSSDLVARFGVSRQAIHRHLRGLIAEGKILRQGSSRMMTSYLLNSTRLRKSLLGRQRKFSKRVAAKGLGEDRLYADIASQVGLLDGLADGAKRRFEFAFTEMVNNAIEHSETKYITVEVTVDNLRASFIVHDTGVGVFENVRRKMGLGGEMEAIQDILKGKATTVPTEHSGQGIFFSSKIADRFVLESHKKRLIIDNQRDDVFVDNIRHRKGTRVLFAISVDMKTGPDEIFKRYTGEDYQFDRTRVVVKLFASGESYVSRSQARRLLHTLTRFREVSLDFSGIPTVGQAFADEVFRVFRNAHPEVTIVPENMNENVAFMIRRARLAE